jgi:hypothetical protein
MEKLALTHYQEPLSRDTFLTHVREFRPFVLDVDVATVAREEAVVRDVVETLKRNESVVDVSCEDIGKFFRGDSVSREKIDMKLSVFVEGFECLRLKGKGSHYTHDTDLNLFLSQACYFRADSDQGDSRVGLLEGIDKDVCVPVMLKKEFQSDFDIQQANMWMNYYESVTNLHYDAYNNLLQVKFGSKKVLLVSPEFTGSLSPNSICSLTAPNHSNVSCEKLHSLLNPSISCGPISDKSILESFALPFRFYVAELTARGVLFIPEGWWHFVLSSDCTMALNHWFDSPLTVLSKAASNRRSTANAISSYVIRSAFHELLQADMKRLEVTIVSAYNWSSEDIVAEEVSTESAKRRRLHAVDHSCRLCTYHQFEVLVDSLLSEQPSANSNPADLLADVESCLTPAEKEFVIMSFEITICWLWPSYAANNCHKWTQLLLGLSTSATYVLTVLWDRWGSKSPNEGRSTQCVCSGCSASGVALSDTILDLDEFFRQIFNPCGDQAAQVSIRFSDGFPLIILEITGPQTFVWLHRRGS